jgi:hypothetical protein
MLQRAEDIVGQVTHHTTELAPFVYNGWLIILFSNLSFVRYAQ